MTSEEEQREYALLVDLHSERHHRPGATSAVRGHRIDLARRTPSEARYTSP
jgi:hypothetical protein